MGRKEAFTRDPGVKEQNPFNVGEGSLLKVHRGPWRPHRYGEISKPDGFPVAEADV